MNTHTLLISKMIHGGLGLGQLPDGRLAMVSGALPGEKVTMQVLEEKRSYVSGRVLSIHEPGSARIDPPCPYYTQCGGCDLQHARYEDQLVIKRAILLDLLTRQETLPESAIGCGVASTLASPATTGYRQRIRLQVGEGGALGFRQRQSHRIVPVDSCLIARRELNELLALLIAHPKRSRLLSLASELEFLYNPASGMVTLLTHLTRKPRPADIGFARELVAELPLLERLCFTGSDFALLLAAPENGDMSLTTSLTLPDRLPLTLSWEVGGFCQVNLEQNDRLVATACSFANAAQGETVLDLFCGAGNFSLPLAASAGSVLGIEGQGSAIRSAKINGSANNLANTTFRKQPIHKAVEDLAQEGRQFDCVILDPPRQGAPGLAARLAALCRHRLVYISCDPATLCRDLGDLVHHGFVIRRIQPVDMFPQTHHIETVVLLEKH